MFDLRKCPRDKDGNYLAQTRDGHSVTLMPTMVQREPLPWVGYVSGIAAPQGWTRSGAWMFGANGEMDLINIPEPKRSGEVWVNFFIETSGEVNATNAEWSHSEKIARVLVHWTEGEGMERK